MAMCEICKEEADVLHFIILCMHEFCYCCIMRHLRTKDFCPRCFARPVTRFDTKTNLKKISNFDLLSKLTVERSQAQMKKMLVKYRILVDNADRRIEDKFKDLVDILYKEQYKDRKLSNCSIAWCINQTEMKRRKKTCKDKDVIDSLKSLRKSVDEGLLKKGKNEGY